MRRHTRERVLSIMAFNANGVVEQARELEMILHERKIDILLINETHLKEKRQISADKLL